MRLLRVEAQDYYTGEIKALVPVDDLTVIIGRNGAGKSLILEWIERILKQDSEFARGKRGPSDQSIHSAGWAHLRLNVSGSPGSDWPWFRRLLIDGLGGEWDSDIPGLGQALGDPDDDVSFASFAESALDACRYCDLNPIVAALAASLFAGEELDVAVQDYPGGSVELLVDMATHEAAADLKAIAEDAVDRPGCPSWAKGLLDPRAEVVRTIYLGDGLPQDEKVQPLYDRLPLPVRVSDVIGDPERRVDNTISELLTGPSGKSSWTEESSDGALRIRAEVTAIAGQLERGANALLPPFVVEMGVLRVRLSTLGSWADGVPRSIVRWQYSGQDNDVHFTMLGAGARRWVAAGLDAACGDILRSAPDTAERLYLIDEPEMHLHPLAQVEVREWIEARVAEGATAVLATHSPVFLATSRHSATVIALVRQGTVASWTDFTADVLNSIGAIDGLAEAIGTDRIAALQLTRGILVIEGEHDRKVIEEFFGAELARARIRMLPIRGTDNAMALADSELLSTLGVPLCVVFDEVRDSVLADRDPDVPWSAEEKKIRKLLDAFAHVERPGQRVEYAGFSLPDVICAIPMVAIRRAFPQVLADLDWPVVIDAWRSARPQNTGFKPFALKRFGLDGVNPDQFVELSLEAIEPADQPAPELIRAVKTAEAKLLGLMPPPAPGS